MNAAKAAPDPSQLSLPGGSDDRASKPSLAEYLCAEVPTAELVMIPGIKMSVCRNQPERSAELFKGFIASHEY